MRNGIMDKSIVITGSSGLVATELISRLLRDTNYHIIAVSTHPDIVRERYRGFNNITCLALNDLRGMTSCHIYAVVHCAFARNARGREIASSIQYLAELIEIVKNFSYSLPLFINISSQSVYGQREIPLWNEETPIDPNYLYAMGKYATEVLVDSAFSGTDCNHTNIRLASVNENARFLNTFVNNAIDGNPITVIGGGQRISFIDVRDVADALVAVIEHPRSERLATVYNLGTGVTRTILELAEDVKRLYQKDYGMPVTIEVEDSDVQMNVGMDNRLFCSTFYWQPKYTYDDMITSLLEYNLGERKSPNCV